MGYNPQPYTGDRYLFSGISNAGAGLAQGLADIGHHIERAREEQKQLTTAAKSADFFAQASPEFLKEIGQTPDSWKNLGARDKVAAHAGFMKALGAQEVVEGLRERQLARRQESALGTALANFSGTDRPAASPMEPAEHADTEAMAGRLSPEAAAEFGTVPRPYEERLRSALQTPDLGGRNAVMLMRALQDFQPKDANLPLGRMLQFSDGTVAYGTGGAPQLRYPEAGKPQPKLFPAVDPSTGKPIPGMALTEGGSPVQTGERGGLKDLSQTEVDRIAALQQAAKDMDRIETLFKGIGSATSGPVVGRLREANPYDENRLLLEQAVNAAVPNLARGVFREVGVLTDEDVKRYAKQFPTLKDPPDVRTKKLAQLRQRIKEGQKTTMEELTKAGRDVTGFDQTKEPPPAEGAVRFEAEDEARKAGKKAGDVIELYLPERGGYVKVRLK